MRDAAQAHTHAAMRTTVSLDDDAAQAARRLARRERISLSAAVSELIRRGAAAALHATYSTGSVRGRFALLPVRDEVITLQQVRALMDREGM